MGYEINQTLYRASVEGTYVYYAKWRVYQITPKGGWVTQTLPLPVDPSTHLLQSLSEVQAEDPSDRKWLPLETRFASTTKEEALSRLRARNGSYVGHCLRRLREAERRASILKSCAMPELELPTLRLGSLLQRQKW